MAKINDTTRLVRMSMLVECLQCYLQLQRVALHFSVHGPRQTSLQDKKKRGTLCKQPGFCGILEDDRNNQHALDVQYPISSFIIHKVH